MAKVSAFGLRCVPDLVRAAAFAACVVPATAASAAAQDICSGLRQVMAHAPGDFESLLISGERSLAGAAPARTLLPDASRCEVREGPGAVEYRCRMTAYDTGPAEARTVFRREVARVRGCFAGLMARGDGDYTGTTEWTGAVIWEPRPGLRAAVVFVAADEIAQVAGSGEGPPEDANAAWIVVEQRKR